MHKLSTPPPSPYFPLPLQTLGNRRHAHCVRGRRAKRSPCSRGQDQPTNVEASLCRTHSGRNAPRVLGQRGGILHLQRHRRESIDNTLLGGSGGNGHRNGGQIFESDTLCSSDVFVLSHFQGRESSYYRFFRGGKRGAWKGQRISFDGLGLLFVLGVLVAHTRDKRCTISKSGALYGRVVVFWKHFTFRRSWGESGGAAVARGPETGSVNPIVPETLSRGPHNESSHVLCLECTHARTHAPTHVAAHRTRIYTSVDLSYGQPFEFSTWQRPFRGLYCHSILTPPPCRCHRHDHHRLH